MHTAGIFLSSLRPAIVNAFSQTPACVILIPCHGWPRASPDAGPPSMDYVRTNFHGPEIHRAFRPVERRLQDLIPYSPQVTGVKVRLLVPISFLGWLCKAY